MLGERIVEVLEGILDWPYTEHESGNQFNGRIAIAFQQKLGVHVNDGSPDKGSTLPEGIHLYLQPYSSQRTPDIAIFNLEIPLKIIAKTGWLPDDAFRIEVKRSKIGRAMWNSGFPRQNTIYILNTKHKEIEGTTMVLGRGLVSEDDEQKVIDFKERLKYIKSSFKDFGTFYLQHLRPMFNESSDSAIWLEHKDRKKREEAVMSFIRNQNRDEED